MCPAAALGGLRARVSLPVHVHAHVHMHTRERERRCLISVAGILDPLLQPDRPGTPRFGVYVTRLFPVKLFLCVHTGSGILIGFAKYSHVLARYVLA